MQEAGAQPKAVSPLQALAPIHEDVMGQSCVPDTVCPYFSFTFGFWRNVFQTSILFCMDSSLPMCHVDMKKYIMRLEGVFNDGEKLK